MRVTGHSKLVCMCMLAAAVALLPPLAAAGSPSTREPGRRSLPDAKITGFHLVETKSGTKLWEIWGDLAEVFEKEGLAKVMKVSRQVTVALHSPQGILTSRSDKATVNLRTKDVRLEGNVTAATDQGSRLHTELLDWSAESRRLFTRSPVTLVRGRLVSRGVGMEADSDLGVARLYNRVQSDVIPGSAAVTINNLPISRKGGTR